MGDHPELGTFPRMDYTSGVRRALLAALRSRLRPALEEQWAGGLGAAFLLATADLVAVAVRADDPPLLHTWVQLLGLYLPLGFLGGTAAGLVVATVRDAPWLARTRFTWSRIGSRGRSPERFAHVLSAAAGLGLFVLGMRTAAVGLAGRLHDAALIAWAIALAAPVVAILAIVFAAGLDALLRRVSPLLGDFASGRSAIFVLSGAIASVVFFVVSEASVTLQQLNLLDLLWLPSALVLHLAWVWVVRRVGRGRGRVVRRATYLAILATGLVFGVSIRTYGHANSVRGAIETHSIGGRALARRWRSWTDRDRDGHAWAYGGDDCNDSDPRIHPGAEDPAGDGIDSDCFGGDGTPALEGLHSDGDFAPRPAGLAARPNLILLTIDALRPDRLGAYGYERPTSPNIDALAAESVRFTRVLAPSSRSVRSIPAVFAGVYPSEVAYGGEFLFPSVRDENELLAERLSAHGYRMHAMLGTDYFSRVRGFFQGFDEIAQPPHAARSFPVDEALRVLDGMEDGAGPWCLWVHLFNVHLPYLPDGVASMYGDTEPDWYDTEITLADREVGRLVEALKARGVWDDTVLVFASDHGEGLGEHGHIGHASSLYEEEVRTPLLIRVPGLAPRVVERAVSLIDVMPTVLNLVDAPAPQRIVGRSLVADLTGTRAQGAEQLPIFSELLPDGLFPFDQKSVTVGDEKLIWWIRDGRVALFDLATDPAERVDLSESRRERANELHGVLRAWMASGRRGNRSDDVARAHVLRRVPDMDESVLARYPGFTLLGYDVGARTLSRGDTVELDFYFRSDRAIEEDLFFNVELVGPDGYVVHDFGAPHYPVFGAYHTNEWKRGEVVQDPIHIVVPDAVRPGTTFEATLLVFSEDRRRTIGYLRGPATPEPSEPIHRLPLGTFTVN